MYTCVCERVRVVTVLEADASNNRYQALFLIAVGSPNSEATVPVSAT